jgi:hypothetical protein
MIPGRTILFSLASALLAAVVQAEPRVVTPTGPPRHPASHARIVYPWKQEITATVFWIGEAPSGRNKTPNHKSSWDQEWQKNFGGYDDPNPANRIGYRPKAFHPKLNTFYVALPYNDCINHAAHKPEASRVIPWYRRSFTDHGDTVCKGRWVQLHHQGKSCYAQWEDCGPWTTDDWQYVFGNKRPRNTQNKNAGIDVSPAVRDYLGLKSGYRVHWRFVEFANVPRGPWSLYGSNNPFVNPEVNPDLKAAQRYNDYLRKLRDEAYQKKDVRRSP